MQKLNELMYAYLPETAFLAFSIRLIVLGASIGDAIALLVVAGLIASKHLLNKKKVEQFDELKGLIDELKVDHEDKLTGLKNAVDSLKTQRALEAGSKRVNLEQEQAKPKRYF
jgi:hypothetical protein